MPSSATTAPRPSHGDASSPDVPRPFHLLFGDAVEHPLRQLRPSPDSANTFKIVANLPYAIATPWLDGILTGPLPATLVLMLQQEAAQRYAAPARQRNLGAISISFKPPTPLPPARVPAACFTRARRRVLPPQSRASPRALHLRPRDQICHPRLLSTAPQTDRLSPPAPRSHPPPPQLALEHLRRRRPLSPQPSGRHSRRRLAAPRTFRPQVRLESRITPSQRLPLPPHASSLPLFPCRSLRLTRLRHPPRPSRRRR